MQYHSAQASQSTPESKKKARSFERFETRARAARPPEESAG